MRELAFPDPGNDVFTQVGPSPKHHFEKVGARQGERLKIRHEYRVSPQIPQLADCSSSRGLRDSRGKCIEKGPASVATVCVNMLYRPGALERVNPGMSPPRTMESDRQGAEIFTGESLTKARRYTVQREIPAECYVEDHRVI